MGAFVGLLMDRIWNGASDLQAGVEIYHMGYPRLWLILSSQNAPFFGTPISPPPCGQLAASYLFAYKEPGPNFWLYTQI